MKEIKYYCLVSTNTNFENPIFQIPVSIRKNNREIKIYVNAIWHSEKLLRDLSKASKR